MSYYGDIIKRQRQVDEILNRYPKNKLKSILRIPESRWPIEFKGVISKRDIKDQLSEKKKHNLTKWDIFSIFEGFGD